MDTKAAVAAVDSDLVATRGLVMTAVMTRTMKATTEGRDIRDTKMSEKLTYLLVTCDLLSECMDFSLK